MTGGYDADVLIVGGGMVGASLAHALSVLPLRVAVVEAAPPRGAMQSSYDDRSTALALGSRRIFETLGLWDALRPAATPIGQIHVSDRGHFGATRLRSEDEGVEALGYVVENRTLGQVLWQSMTDVAARVYFPARVADVDVVADAVTVSIAADEQVQACRARLLVVADGARSATRAALGIDAGVRDYGQTAVIANVTPQRLHGNVAYERFTPNGPVAFLPMSNGRCSVVWTLPPDDAARVMALDDSGFLAALQDAFGFRLGRLRRCGARHAYPLSLVQARRLTGPRHVVVGNAAHSLHPVAGQGFNLGLRDVAALAEVIADAGDDGDPGDPRVLRAFAHWRRGDHRRVVGFTDGLIRLFGAEAAPVRAARSAGLIALGLLDGPRSLLARQSMGVAGRLPRLARGVPLR